ncbi:MAG TPA: transglutaminase domain-containing protein [Ferruginibacter sp.]|nr:transglutaminase domain-containing protein [Ferruginibacter sp.]
MKRLAGLVLLICLLQSPMSWAQSGPDDHAQTLGALPSLNVAQIADTLAAPFGDKKQKARAFYYWITHHIAIDVKATKGNDQKKSNPEDVVQLRRATPLGYSKLFQEMCSQANIRCLSVDGYVKNSAEDIENKADEINHSWNVVQLGQSPTEWYYVDCAKGSGSLDKQMKVFTPEFTSGYFFADKNLFNLDHYPDNTAWQLASSEQTPKGLSDFYRFVYIAPAAFDIGLSKPNPLVGHVRTSIKSATTFNFRSESLPKKVEIVLESGNKKTKPEEVTTMESGGGTQFKYQFKRDDTYIMSILSDGKLILQYLVEATE